MADTLKLAIAGGVGHASSSAHKDAENAVQHSYKLDFTDYDIPVASLNCVAIAQTDITLTAAYWVPSVTQGAQATNYVTLTLGKGAVGSSITAFDAITSETAFTAGTARSFSIAPSTDTVSAGDKLWMNVSHNGTTAGVISGTLIVEYKLTN